MLNLSLTDGRHIIPQATNGSIFGQEISAKLLINPAALEDYATHKLWVKFCDNNLTEFDGENSEGEYVYTFKKGVHVNLYVTGLTVALVAVLNVCRDYGISVTLYHYDRENKIYYAQNVA